MQVRRAENIVTLSQPLSTLTITSNNVAASLTPNQNLPVTFKINLYSSSDLEIQVQEMEYKNKRDMLLGVGMPCLSPRQVSIFTTKQKADSVHEQI